MGNTKYLSAFEQGMVVGARRTGFCQELQRCWVFQEWSTTQRTSSQLNTTVGSIEVHMASIPVERLTPCKVLAPTN